MINLKNSHYSSNTSIEFIPSALMFPGLRVGTPRGGAHPEDLPVGLVQSLLGAGAAPGTGGLVVRQDDHVRGERAPLAGRLAGDEETQARDHGKQERSRLEGEPVTVIRQEARPPWCKGATGVRIVS